MLVKAIDTPAASPETATIKRDGRKSPCEVVELVAVVPAAAAVTKLARGKGNG